MMFVALSILAVIAMIGLAVDSMNVFTTYRQSQFIGNMAALAALEQYFKNPEDSIEAKLEAAENRARSIFADNPTAFQEFSLLNDDSQPNGLKLLPGQWKQPGEDNPTGKPYFEEYTGLPDQTINAFRITGSATQSTRLLFLGMLFGENSSARSIGIESVATVAPRRAVFLIDLSSTIITETYKDRTIDQQTTEPEKGRGAAYGFLLSSDNPTVSGRNWHDEQYWTVVNNAPNRNSAPAAHQTNPFIHFKDDYKKVALFNDTDYRRNAGYVQKILKLHPDPAADPRFAVGSARVYARVDGYRDADHLGPQPLRNIIAGVRSIVQEFKDRRVYGDKVSVIFFDESTDWRRTILPTDDFDYVLEALSIGSAGDPPLVADDPAVVNVSGLDPAAYGGVNLSARLALYPQPSANTNIILPLSYAQEFLANDSEVASAISTTDFVVLATDGLSNCRPESVGYSCNDVYEYYRDSMAVIKGSILTQYINSSIPIHVMLTGAMSGPHTLNVQKSSTDPTCATDSELRAQGRSFVAARDPSVNEAGWAYDFFRPRDYANKSAEKPYYYVNEDWYRIAVQTRGLWVPIRPATMPNKPCAAEGTTRTCDATVTRQLYDPYCKTPEKQSLEAAGRILGQNPYVVVRTSSDNYVSEN